MRGYGSLAAFEVEVGGTRRIVDSMDAIGAARWVTPPGYHVTQLRGETLSRWSGWAHPDVAGSAPLRVKVRTTYFKP